MSRHVAEVVEVTSNGCGWWLQGAGEDPTGASEEWLALLERAITLAEAAALSRL